MTQEERSALITQRADLQRKYQKRRNAPGYANNAAELLRRIEAIDEQLNAEPQ